MDKWNSKCSVTGVGITKILIGSHIVPWRDSNDDERLDVDNGIILTPNLDGLFDRYLIPFEDSGKIIISSKRDGICEILRHNYNAILIKEYSVEIWIKYLNSIKNNKYNLNRISINSIKTAKKFTWESRVNKILLAHKSLI